MTQITLKEFETRIDKQIKKVISFLTFHNLNSDLKFTGVQLQFQNYDGKLMQVPIVICDELFSENEGITPQAGDYNFESVKRVKEIMVPISEGVQPEPQESHKTTSNMDLELLSKLKGAEISNKRKSLISKINTIKQKVKSMI